MKAKARRLYSDTISTLPQNIIEDILCLIPLRDAVRTSVLSKKWRYKWITVPKLVFVEKDYSSIDQQNHQILTKPLRKYPYVDREKLIRTCNFFYALHQVMSLHCGPIVEITIITDAKYTCLEINHVLAFSSMNKTVKKVTLDFTYPDHYNLPESFFSMHQLTDLSLSNCKLYPRPTCDGFRSLINLYLHNVITTNETVVRILSKSPLLKSFTLKIEDHHIKSHWFTIIESFKYLPVIERLYLSMPALKYIPEDGVRQKLVTELVHLKYLCLHIIDLANKGELPFLVLLMRSSPNLEKLKLQMSYTKSKTDCVTLQDSSDSWLEHLNELKIVNFADSKLELEFVKLILVKSPVLKKVRILLHSQVDIDLELKISKIILRSPRASQVVDITVENLN